ncbi:MAG TPA: mercuric reductase [Polyangia bacterium]|jgi:pyruvate/2-oxoglutarate dehydrogenase complex dihydrolipoamide dehydrogenase (E3) component
MTVDVLVIGSGQAGVPLAVRLANAGRRVVLAERALLGGTCTNYGCTPTKTMIASARAAHVGRTAARLGVHCGEVRVDFAAVVARKNAIVTRWREGVARTLAGARERLRVIDGPARFVGAHEIDVAGTRYRADTVVINSGVRPAMPSIPGLAEVPWLDNHRAMSLESLPRHLVVLGGGYIGCELGQMFRRFGSAVTIVDRGKHLLGHEDPDVAASLEDVFRAEGIDLVQGVAVERVARAGDELVVHARGNEIRGSHLLVAVGRRANTDDLGCDAAGIALDERGYVIVDDGYQTSTPGVYAVGDVTGGPQFTHSSWDDHRILFERLLGRGTRGRADRIVPYAVFTDPQIGHVGLHESEARARGMKIEVASMPFGQVARAIEMDELAGVMKVLIDAGDGRLLGATIIGADAGELIHIFVPLIRAGTSARSIVDAEFIHPTFAEGVQTLVMRLPRYALDFQESGA